MVLLKGEERYKNIGQVFTFHYRGTRMVVLVFTYEGVVSTVGRCITTGQMVRRQSVDSGYLRRE